MIESGRVAATAPRLEFIHDCDFKLNLPLDSLWHNVVMPLFSKLAFEERYDNIKLSNMLYLVYLISVSFILMSKKLIVL